MRRVLIAFIILQLSAVISGCTWVKLTPEGEKVRVLSSSEVSGCQRLGKTTVSLKAKVAGFERKADKVKQELQTLARNRAHDLNGDTVVPITEVENGQQVFLIYRCIGLSR